MVNILKLLLYYIIILTSFSFLMGGRILNDEEREDGELGRLFICDSSELSLSFSLSMLSLSFLSSFRIFFLSTDKLVSFCLAESLYLSSSFSLLTLSLVLLFSTSFCLSEITEVLPSRRVEFPDPLLLFVLSPARSPCVFPSAGLTSVFGFSLTLSLYLKKTVKEKVMIFALHIYLCPI